MVGHRKKEISPIAEQKKYLDGAPGPGFPRTALQQFKLCVSSREILLHSLPAHLEFEFFLL